MKVLWCLAFCCFAVSAYVVDEDKTRIHGENGWYVPQVDGSSQWLDMEAADSYLEAVENIYGLIPNPVNYYLYTKSNPTKGKQITESVESIKNSNFNPAHPTRFIITGWNDNHLIGMSAVIRNSYLRNRDDHNIIVVDWPRANSLDYASSVVAVPEVGKKLANMIDYLVYNHDMSLATTNVIGHSLGAHVAGFAGKNVKRGQIRVIYGLDPASILFFNNKPDTRLNSTDGFYVESIQTDGGGLGFLKPIGRGAFYPNGGKTQPGCPLDILGSCSHGRAVTYFAETVDGVLYNTKKCENYLYAVANNCGDKFSSVKMGADQNAFLVAGDFYVPVNSQAPFGVSDQST